MYYKDGKTYGSTKSIRNELSNMSLPVFMSDEFIESLGYMVIVDGEKPIPSDVQYVVEGAIEVHDGVPIQQYVLVDMFSGEDKAEQETKFYADKVEVEVKLLKEEALAKIAELEASQLRSVRELMLDSSNTFAKAKLVDIEAQIQVERAKL